MKIGAEMMRTEKDEGEASIRGVPKINVADTQSPEYMFFEWSKRMI